MSHTLEELKAMDGRELKDLWSRRVFPFEMASECRACLTMHQLGTFCDNKKHADFTRAARTIKLVGFCPHSPEALKQNLEELYALRLFYDHLYPQPSAADTLEHPSGFAAQPDLGVETIALPEDKLEAMRENEYDSRANTR